MVDENYVLRIPDSIPLDKAVSRSAPGITCSPLRHRNAGPGKGRHRLGLGGLGHVGVKLCGRHGRRGHVLSQSLKKMEGLRLGAHHYYATNDPDTFKEAGRQLRPDHQHGVGEPQHGPLPEPAKTDGTLVGARRSRSRCRCSLVGMRRTLALVDRRYPGDPGDARLRAEHDVTPEIETIEASYVNEAYERVIASDVRLPLRRHRDHLEAASFNAEDCSQIVTAILGVTRYRPVCAGAGARQQVHTGNGRPEFGSHPRFLRAASW